MMYFCFALFIYNYILSLEIHNTSTLNTSFITKRRKAKCLKLERLFIETK